MRHLQPGRVLAGAVILALGATGALAPVASAAKYAGAVYTQTNGAPNRVVVFGRKSNGKLVQVQTVKTGGTGGHQAQPGCTPPPGCPILDADSEVNVSPNGKLVFAVNAGSNTVTSFRQTSSGLQRVSVRSSGGTFPTSVTSAGNLLYVLNQNSGNIHGFHVSSNGALHSISGSTRALSANPPVGFGARQIGFDRTGRLLVVSVLGASVLDTFVLDSSDKPLTATAFPSSTPLPFGFAFDLRNRLVVSQLSNPMTLQGHTSTYDVSSSGGLAANDTKSSNGTAPCWVAITKNGRYVFVVNTGGGTPATVARYRLENSGALTFLGLTAPNGNEFARTDEVLSRDSKYLYVLAPSVKNGNTSHIDEYRVGSGGTLTLIGATPSTLAVGASGLDGR